ncbi:MAG: hypothetical protein ACI9GH_000293 [Candidatus Paceibacteria bacterium]|jgi:hypothetical protein
MQTIISKLFQRKSEVVMLFAGLTILASVITVATTGDFVFWKITKFFYAVGVVLIIFDK